MADDTRTSRPFGREPNDDRDYPRDRGSDGGTIAQRGFGNARSGFGRDEQDRGHDDRSGFERGGYARNAESRPYRPEEARGSGRDFGDSTGYGTGGSARSFRDVTGRGYDDERYSRPENVFRGESRSRSYGGQERSEERYRGGNDYLSGNYGADQGYGRGSRDDRDMTGYRGERGFLERAGDEVFSWFGDDDASRRRQQDAQSGDAGATHHRGRGPKGYRRSDERIREDVSDRLTDDPQVDASEVDVAVADGEVTLSGTVSSRFEKRRAEDVAESVSGVTHVQNNLRVTSGTTNTGAMGSTL
ncbi:MAG TPA: BON domain-containing protein [Beijerinckiaceae bacterium]|jgi:osmotically-inducible protein OsmY